MNAAPRRHTLGQDATLAPDALPLEGEPSGCPLCGTETHRRTCPASDDVNDSREGVSFQ